jgi:carbon starvation protein
MLLEGVVAIIAIIAACVLEPGIYFAINSPASFVGNDPQLVSEAISAWGFPVTKDIMESLASEMGENSLFGRSGGAPSLAVGMASIFASAFGEKLLSMWYHFAIMFEAIFILTTLDAGTRVARFMLQDMLKPLTKNCHFSAIFCSFLIVSAWGYFLYIGVIDPNGGVNILWPLFGMSNQMLAGIALMLATTIIAKTSQRKFCFITLVPLIFLVITISIAVIEKVFSSDPKLGFFALASDLQNKINNSTNIGAENMQILKQATFNQYLVGYVALCFMLILWVVVIDGMRRIIVEWREVKSCRHFAPIEQSAKRVATINR